MREFARRAGAARSYVPFGSRTCASTRPRRGAAPAAGAGAAAERRPGLFAYPAQSNFSGVRHPLRWIKLAQDHGYDVLLDAAAYLPTNQLDLSAVKPSFVTVSWYKVFGFPTGVGCLIARRDALAASAALVRRRHRPRGHRAGRWHALAPDEAGFEDGTVNFLHIPDVDSGLYWVTASAWTPSTSG